MKRSTEDRIKGTFHQVRGKLKQKVGKVIDNADLESQGKSENLTGKGQEKLGQIEDVFEK
jgi:uncharacterized protein YjbJ (UPF0337 family)